MLVNKFEEFSDENFAIFDEDDDTRKIKFNLNNLTHDIIREISAADANAQMLVGDYDASYKALVVKGLL